MDDESGESTAEDDEEESQRQRETGMRLTEGSRQLAPETR